MSSVLRHPGVPRSMASNPWDWSRPAREVQEEFQGDRPAEIGMLWFELKVIIHFALVSPNKNKKTNTV